MLFEYVSSPALKIEVPATNILAPASIANLAVIGLIPQSTERSIEWPPSSIMVLILETLGN